MRPRFLLIPVLCGILVANAWADEKQQPSTSREPLVKAPANVKELKDLEHRVQEVYKKVTPMVVGIQIGGASGSGVIVSEDGYVLTAGHVSRQADTTCTVIMPDGKRLKAKSLGQNIGIDSGLIKITEEGKWPHVEMGESKDLAKGQWVISLGHPHGYIR